MDERYTYNLSEIDDECRPRSPNMKGLLADLDLMDLKLSNFTDIYSASNGGSIDNWETEFISMETQNGSEDSASLNGYDFGFESQCCTDLRRPVAAAEKRFPGQASFITPDLEEKSFDFAFRNCHEGYLMESLKDCTQSLLNILEKVTKTGPDQEKLESASPEESKIMNLEKKVRDLQEKNLRLAFTRDLLLDQLTKPKTDIKLKVLQDKFRYANSLAKLVSEKKHLLEDELRKLRRHMQFIQIRLCGIEEENYRLKKENGQFKLMIQNILRDKNCKYSREEYVKDPNRDWSWLKFEPNHCDRCTLLSSLREKGFTFKSDGSLVRTKTEETSNGHSEKEASFNIIEDDDLEIDGETAQGEGG